MITYVTAEGSSSMPVCSQLLGRRLGVRELRTDVYLGMEEKFNVPLLSFGAVKELWRDLRFLVALNRAGGGLVHLSNHHQGRYGPFLRSPFIITVHDLIRYFDLHGSEPLIERPDFRERFFLGLDFLGIRRAVRVIAVSRHTKSDLIEHLGIPEEKISVVYHGLDHGLYRPVSGPRPVPYPYILYVGAEHPRKNLHTLLRAFRRLKRDGRFRELKLVKIGKAGDPEAEFRRPTLDEIGRLRLERDVVFAGFVPQERMPLYYSHAECLAFPSLYEGFGLPPLEAMACGCPVVSSNASAIPEVVGDAAVTLDPLDDAALADALGRVLTDASHRRHMIGRGLERAALFSWEKAAQETLRVYEQVKREIA